MTDKAPRGALEGLRVIELSDERTQYCGKLLAELGADVVLVEPPGGAPARRAAPSAGGVGLSFAYHNASKRSIVIDPDDASDLDTLVALVGGADILLRGDLPGSPLRAAVDADTLRVDAPALVDVSITPFGETGPLARVDAPDLVCVAMGGLLSLGGYADGGPVAPPQSQALFAAGSFGAVATLLALHHAETTGEGQHVDVSIQQCVTMALENAMQFYDLEGTVRGRTGGQQRVAGTGLFPTTDGYVFLLAGGIGGNRFWGNFVRWLGDSGAPGTEGLEGERWGTREFMASDEAKGIVAHVFGPYAATRTKTEVYLQSQRYRVPCAPVSRASDVLDGPQLKHRGFFHDIAFGGVRAKVPGAPYLLSETPWRGGVDVPEPGQHDAQLRAELPTAMIGGRS